MTPLPRLLSKALAVSLLLTLLALAWSAVSPLLASHAENGQAIEHKRVMLGRLQAVAAYAGEIERHIEASRRVLGDEEFLKGDGDELIAADLLTHLKAIVAEHGASITSARPAPLRELGSFDLIGLRIDLSGPIDAVHGTLRAVEANVPWLSVENATFRAERRSETDDSAPVFLSVQMEVLGAVPRERPGRKGGKSPA